MKKYANLALAYAVVALVAGVFYREFTKLSGFEGVTRLSLVHGHYLALGTLFFLVALVLEKLFAFSVRPGAGGAVLAYNVGLNVAAVGFLARGLADVLAPELPKALDASISGVAGIGHVLLGVGLILILLKVRAAAAPAAA